MLHLTTRGLRALFGTPLHLWTCVALVLTAAALLLENLDGYHNHFGGDYSEEPPVINWAHGWPANCLVRTSILARTGLKPGIRIVPAGTVESYTSRWPFDS